MQKLASGGAINENSFGDRIPIEFLPAATAVVMLCSTGFDRGVGDFDKADVLIEGRKIAAVMPNIQATVTMIGASQMIELPTGHQRLEPSRARCRVARRTGCPDQSL